MPANDDLLSIRRSPEVPTQIASSPFASGALPAIPEYKNYLDLMKLAQTLEDLDDIEEPEEICRVYQSAIDIARTLPGPLASLQFEARLGLLKVRGNDPEFFTGALSEIDQLATSLTRVILSSRDDDQVKHFTKLLVETLVFMSWTHLSVGHLNESKQVLDKAELWASGETGGVNLIPLTKIVRAYQHWVADDFLSAMADAVHLEKSDPESNSPVMFGDRSISQMARDLLFNCFHEFGAALEHLAARLEKTDRPIRVKELLVEISCTNIPTDYFSDDKQLFAAVDPNQTSNLYSVSEAVGIVKHLARKMRRHADDWGAPVKE